MKFRISKRDIALPEPELVWLFEKGSTKVVQELVDANTSGLILSDLEGVVRVINSSACALIRTTKKEAFGLSLVSLIRQSKLASRQFKEALTTGKRFDTIWYTAEGNRVLINTRPIGGQEYSKLGSLIILHDLTTINYQAKIKTQNNPPSAFRISNQRGDRKKITVQRRLSLPLDKVLEHGELAINRGARILLAGETGSGKTEIARTLHGLCFQEDSPFIHVNCGGIPESLFESEMFGYEKGTFTGALQNGKAGHIESANNGILFLDEVGEMPLPVQSKLLTFLEENRVQRVGSSKTVEVNVRLISASNQPLLQMVKDGRFRMDLYYRLAVITLAVPPLRDQPELLRHLIESILSKINRTRTPRLTLSESLYSWLHSYKYPGNIRELKNLLEVLSITADASADITHLARVTLWGEDVLKMDQDIYLGHRIHETCNPPDRQGDENLKQAVLAFEEQLIHEAIRKHGSKRKAARALGIDVSTIIRKMTRAARERLPSL